MDWCPEEERKAKELAQGPLGQQLSTMPIRFASGIMIASPSEGRIGVRTATATLLELGDSRYAVTCNHVLESYRGSLRDRPDTVFQLGDLQFDPLERLAGASVRHDLAAIRLDGLDHSKTSDNPDIGHQFFCSRGWPPDNAKDGDVVSLGGYPERWRKFDSLAEIEMAAFCLGTVSVSGASDDQFGIRLERDFLIEQFNHESKDELRQFSGMSGSPVLIERTEGVTRFELVGVAKEFSQDLDYIVVAQASLIRPDGSIVK